MASLQTTCYATFFQSRYAIKSKNRGTFVLHRHSNKPSFHIPVLNVARGSHLNDEGVKNCNKDESWTDVSSSDVHFSGWSSTETERQNTRSIIATGVFLLAGITFTSLYLSRQLSLTFAEIRQHASPLSTQEAVFSAFDSRDFEDAEDSIELANSGFYCTSKSKDGICSKDAQTAEMGATLGSRNMHEFDVSESVKDDDHMDENSGKYSMDACNRSEFFPSVATSNPQPSYKFSNGEDEPCTIMETYESRKKKNSPFSAHNHDPHVLPGKVLVPPVVDEIQLKTLKALKVLKVTDNEAVASDICTRREYARWLVSASNLFSSNSASKVYPAMYIENVSELAFDDVMPTDPDFASIQGLAEAGIISSRLWEGNVHPDNKDQKFCFYPESPLCRQDLVSWKIALETKLLPKADEKILYGCSGFMDIDKIGRDAWPAVIEDFSSSEPGIITLAFGYTKLFHPGKPVTKGQAAIALSAKEASDTVAIEEGIHDRFQREMGVEREKISAMEALVAELRLDFERLKGEEDEAMYSDRERNLLEREMVELSQLRRDVEVEMQEELEKNKLVLSCTRDRISALQNELECEHEKISQLHYDLGVEKRALSMARLWAEEEGRKAREEAKALERARGRWERHGIKVVVGGDLREMESPGVTWVGASKQTVGSTFGRGVGALAGVGLEKMKGWSVAVGAKLVEWEKVLSLVMQKLLCFIMGFREWVVGRGVWVRGWCPTTERKPSFE